MISQKDFEKEIERRMRIAEKDVNEMLSHEIKDGLQVSEILRFIMDIERKEITSDLDLFIKLIENTLSVKIEKITGNLELVRKISELCRRAVKKIALPGDISKADLESLLKNRRINNILTGTREKLVKVIRNQIKEIEARKHELTSELQNRIMKRVNRTIDEAYELTLKGEDIEKQLIGVLNKIKDNQEQLMRLESELVGLAANEDMNQENVLSLKNKIEECIKLMETEKSLINMRNMFEDELFSIEAEVENLIETEFSKGYQAEKEEESIFMPEFAHAR